MLRVLRLLIFFSFKVGPAMLHDALSVYITWVNVIILSYDTTMPKVRERSRITQDFAVTPWQNRREGNKRDPPGATYVVEEASLLVPSVTASCAPTVPCGGAVIATPQDVDTTGWFIKAPRQHTLDPIATFDSEMTAIPPLSVSGDNSTGACGTGNATALGGTDRGGPGWTGLCQLAITPAGRGMGHIFLPGILNRAVGCGRVSRGARCYGLALRPVPRGVPADPCTEDESTDLLCARLTDFASGEITDVLVARTGGDMCRLAPPEDWLLRQWFGNDLESDEEEDGGAGLNAHRAKWEEVGEWEEVTEWEEDDREGDGEEGKGERGEGDTGEAKELDAAAVCQARDLTEGPPSTHTVVDPHNTADWIRLWRRQLQVRSALALNFEPETLLSGLAALPKLAEFARPFLPPQLAGIAGTGDHSGGGADDCGSSFDTERLVAAGTDQALQSGLQGMQASAGQQAGEVMEMDLEPVVCLGPATLRGLPWTLLEDLD